jgi:putative hydrolase of the HAD superfamily
MKHHAVIFDLFGTLVEVFSFRKYERVLWQMAEQLGAPREEFATGWVETLSMRATGAFATIDANIEHICWSLGVQAEPAALAEAVRMRWEFSRRSLTPRPDAVDTLKRIRATRRKVGLISDCSADVPELWPDTPFEALVDSPIFSCVAGLKKPDPRIYALACKRLRVKPQRCLYVGDGSSNELTGAADAGMCPVLIRVPGEDSDDAYRPDADQWQGPVISALSEVVALLE